MNKTQRKLNIRPLIPGLIALSASNFASILTANAALSEYATRDDMLAFLIMLGITGANMHNIVWTIKNQTKKQMHR